LPVSLTFSLLAAVAVVGVPHHSDKAPEVAQVDI
jgi:hypothetical protein